MDGCDAMRMEEDDGGGSELCCVVSWQFLPEASTLG
jgi:hypothetical protein